MQGRPLTHDLYKQTLELLGYRVRARWSYSCPTQPTPEPVERTQPALSRPALVTWPQCCWTAAPRAALHTRCGVVLPALARALTGAPAASRSRACWRSTAACTTCTWRACT